MNKMQEIETRRLLLRPFNLSDAVQVQEMASDYELASLTCRVPHPYDEKAAKEWILSQEQNAKDNKEIVWAITLKADKTLRGAIGIELNIPNDRGEIGYWIGKEFRGCGFCTEAADAILKVAFENLKLNKVCAAHFKRNDASGKVLHKIGMKYEGCLHQHFKKWDHYEDLKLYAILAEEWHKKQNAIF